MNININSPCNESWSQMAKTENGKFCSSCQHEVVDYASMNDSQILAHITKHGLGCGNWRNDQLQRDIKKPRKYSLKYLWSVILLMVLSRSVSAQEKKPIDTVQVQEDSSSTKVGYGGGSFIKIDSEKCADSTRIGTGSFSMTTNKFHRLLRKERRHYNWFNRLFKRY